MGPVYLRIKSRDSISKTQHTRTITKNDLRGLSQLDFPYSWQTFAISHFFTLRYNMGMHSYLGMPDNK